MTLTTQIAALPVSDDEGHDVPTPPNCIHPVLMRASIASQIGEGCPFPSIAEAARHYGVNCEQLRLYVRGKRPAEPKLCAAFGVVPVTFYLPTKGQDHE